MQYYCIPEDLFDAYDKYPFFIDKLPVGYEDGEYFSVYYVDGDDPKWDNPERPFPVPYFHHAAMPTVKTWKDWKVFLKRGMLVLSDTDEVYSARAFTELVESRGVPVELNKKESYEAQRVVEYYEASGTD